MDPVDPNSLKDLIDIVAQVGIIPGVLLWTMVEIKRAITSLDEHVQQLITKIEVLLDRTKRGSV